MEDCQIVQLYWDRNEQAIPATSEKYGSYCTSIAKNILGNNQDVEECVSDTYLSAWNAIPPHKPSVLSAFLGKIIRNISFNRYKHNTADKRGGGEMALILDELGECVSGHDDLEQTVDRKEVLYAINQFLGRLSPVKRNIFVRRYWYAESITDIAGRYKMTANHVSVQLNRIRHQLKLYLQERGHVI